jgi:hypothetical protein
VRAVGLAIPSNSLLSVLRRHTFSNGFSNYAHVNCYFDAVVHTRTSHKLTTMCQLLKVRVTRVALLMQVIFALGVTLLQNVSARTSIGDLRVDRQRNLVKVTDEAGREHALPIPDTLWTIDDETEVVKQTIHHSFFLSSPNDDVFELLKRYLTFMEAQQNWTISERQHLESVVLRKFFNAVKGSGTMESVGYWKNPDTLFCKWLGVTCVEIEDKNHKYWVIEQLDLAHQNLKGTLPTELALLDSLTTLILRDNQVSSYVLCR